MSNNPFAPAVRQGVNLRALLIGQSGSGKTYSALAVASHLAERIGTKVAVVDTEDRSAEKYAHEKCACAQCRGQGISFVFDVLCLKRCSPDDYMNAMRAAHANGYGVIVLDSISHEWEGPGGCLEIVDANQRQTKNKHAAWGPVTEKHNQFLAAIRNFPGHVVATVRAKEKHQKDGGKIVSLGVLPVQRDGIEYEFDLALFLDQSRGQIVKTRASKLEGWIGTRPGAELANAMLAWANGGEAERDQSRPTQPPSEGFAGAVAITTSQTEATSSTRSGTSGRSSTPSGSDQTQAIDQANREPLGDRDAEPEPEPCPICAGRLPCSTSAGCGGGRTLEAYERHERARKSRSAGAKAPNADGSRWRNRAEAAQDDPGAQALEAKRAELCEWARHLEVEWAGQLLADLSLAESLGQIQAIEGQARAALSREEVARG